MSMPTLQNESITIREFVDQFNAGTLTGDWYLETYSGYQLVSHIRWPKTNPWAVTSNPANPSYDSPFAVCLDFHLYRKVGV